MRDTEQVDPVWTSEGSCASDDAVVEMIRQQVLAQMDVSRQIEDEEVLELIHTVLQGYSGQAVLSIHERQYLAKAVFHALRRLDVLQELIDDTEVTEIMVNGTNRIFYEKQGKLHEWHKSFASEEKLQDVIQQIVGNSNRMVNELHPIVDTRLENGARVNIVLKPIAIDGTALSIRRFPEHPITMEQLIEWDSLSQDMAGKLQQLVQAGYNIFISGGTGSGKTTFLNALSAYIPQDERIVTIEDSAELQIQGIPNLVRLETRESMLEGVPSITIRDLIRSALRMRPDRIIVGECRGAEALDVLQAMNTGHAGSLSTGHANSAEDMLKRLETMVLMGMEIPITAIRGQIASGIDILIHLSRFRDGSRKVVQIAEIKGLEQEQVRLHELFCFQESGEENGCVKGKWLQTGELLCRDKLCAAGL